MSTIKTAYNVLKIAHLSEDAVLLEGPHGIGKSDIVQQFADDNSMYMFPLFLSTQETGDLIGIPDTKILEDGSTVTSWDKPNWLHEMEVKAKEGIHCVLFLDELNRAPLDVRQSALQLVLEGKIHEHELPTVNGIKTLVVSAINPSDEYQVQELDPALLDRFLCLEIDVSVPEWLEWARTKNVLGVIRDFISEFPNRLHYTPNEGKGPTPRAWAKVSKNLDAHKKINSDKATLFDILKGRLGSEVGSQFFSYYENYSDVVKVDDIEDFIVKNVSTDKNIEELGEVIKGEFGKIEAIRKHEIATELIQRHIGKKTAEIALAYLYSLELETCVAILKKIKGVGVRGDYQKIAELDAEINNKGLFRRFVNLAK